MNERKTPRQIVDRQTLAYNARDVDAYCALYAQDAVISTLNTGVEHARGMGAIRKYYTDRFAGSPNLHCAVQGRIMLGNFVIDHELVTGIEDRPLEVVGIYEVRDALIRSACFIRRQADDEQDAEGARKGFNQARSMT